MTLAVNITDGHGFGDEVHHKLLPKKSESNAVFAVHYMVKVVIQLYITNKTEHLVLNEGEPCRL